MAHQLLVSDEVQRTFSHARHVTSCYTKEKVRQNLHIFLRWFTTHDFRTPYQVTLLLRPLHAFVCPPFRDYSLDKIKMHKVGASSNGTTLKTISGKLVSGLKS
jgi:hypothetical protein